MRILFSFLFFVFLATTQGALAQSYSLDDDLIYRINFGSVEDIRILLGKGANPNARTVQGEPILFMAMDRPDEEGARMVRTLVEKGASLSMTDKAGNYPIILAARGGRSEMVSFFIAHGADPHVKAPDGRRLVDIAHEFCDRATAQSIQTFLDREQAYADSFRTPERFREIIRLYSYHSCAYQYWSYFKSARMDPSRAEDTEKRIGDSRDALTKLLAQIQKYYPSTQTTDLQHIADISASNVYDEVDSLLSNRNRVDHGFGAEADLKQRCDAISSRVEIPSVPANLTHP